MIEVKDLSIRQGKFLLEGISFTVPEGDHGVLMGRSGCGKTSILEAICGLRATEAGSVLLAGHDVATMAPGDRGIGFVPQDRSLFPNLPVRENLAFSLLLRNWSNEAIASRVGQLAELMSISHLLDRPIDNLSGGEAQRVSVGRALAASPRVLCLDEPFSSLDEETHEEMSDLLKRVRSETGVTILHVTHSRREAQMIGDLIYRLVDGLIRLDGGTPK
ncbi:MAG TPA: ATP-binding cassette domain-containing protein [Planctomycetes bacterium]|nr:ATP-binding cassette domain-containing protein [Planctomycetota bacterium]